MLPVRAKLHQCRLPSLLAPLLLFSAMLPLRAETRPNQLEEYQAKALLVFNFAKFVVWPEGAFSGTGEAFYIEVVGEDPFGGAFYFARDKSVQGRAVDVQQCPNFKQCQYGQIVYVDSESPAELARVLPRLYAEHSLVVTSNPKLFQAGAAVLLRVDGERLTFDVNLPAARAAGLEISGNLLRHANKVILDDKATGGAH